MTREQYECTTTRCLYQGERLLDDRCYKLRVGGLGHANRQIQQALPLIVERTVDLQRRYLIQPQSAGEVAEILAQRKRRGSEYPGTAARLQHRLKSSRDVEWHETQCKTPLGRLHRPGAFQLVNRRDPLETRCQIGNPLTDLRQWTRLVELGQPPPQLEQRVAQLLDRCVEGRCLQCPGHSCRS